MTLCDYVNGLNTPQLTDNEKSFCEGRLTSQECFESLKTMPLNKTPGNDGLPVEFYKQYWCCFGSYIVDSFNYSYEHGQLSNSQKQAVITLIEKPNKDRTELKNWRPISLLNVDYKIASKALSIRISKVLPSIIHHNQSGYVKGRYIGESIRTILDVMEYTKMNNIPGILVSVVFEKAFDSLEWDFLFAALNKFGFCLSFIHWIKTLCSGIINNGTTTGYFDVERGTRQGDPLSPYLFVTAVELLALAIRQNMKIKGIWVPNNELKLSQYADDTNGILADLESAKEFFKTITEFGRFSGLRINKDKTQAMWLGSMRKCKNKPLSISWPEKPMRILGIYVSYNEQEAAASNFDIRIKEASNCFNVWRQRNLTCMGRI